MKLRALIFAAAAGLAVATSPVSAQQVIVTVDGAEITDVDLALAEAETLVQVPLLAELPTVMRRVYLVDYLIGVQLMAAEAKSAGLRTYGNLIGYDERRALGQRLLAKKVLNAVQPADVKRAYDAEAAAFKPVEEIRVRVVELKTEDEAEKVRGRLGNGADFAALAREMSLDRATAEDGGDLGYVRKGQLRAWLDQPAFALKAGEVSKPIETDRGWMLVRVDERRMRTMPAFEGAKERIASALLERRTKELIAGLRKKANIVVVER